MSVLVSKMVYQAGPRELVLRALLLALADHADDDGVAWPGPELLAQKICKDKRTVQRLLDRLEREGWLRIERRVIAVQTARGWEKRGNKYTLNLARLRGDRSPARLGAEEGNGSRPRVNAQRESAAGHQSEAVQNAFRDDKSDAARRQNALFETTDCAVRDDKNAVPLMNHQEPPEIHHEEVQPPPLPAFAAQGSAKTSWSKQEPEATAKAKATATTSPVQAAEAAGKVVVFPGREVRRDRGPRDLDTHRARLDGEDLVLFDAAVAVLAQCGIAPQTSRRGDRLAVIEQLRLRCGMEPRCSIAEAQQRGVEMWQRYLEANRRGLLRRMLGVRRFFLEGLWLSESRWDWDAQAVRSRASATVGMHRG